MFRHRVAISSAVLAVLLALAVPAAAQTSGSAPPAYTLAMAKLAERDTAAAIAALREATRTHSNYGPAFLRLGALLSARATAVETDHADRREAEQALSRALRLLGDDPEVLLEYGLLLRKQQVRVDARRVLERAWRAAERRGSELPPAQRARLHYEMGRIYEVWWEDWQNLVQIPEPVRGMIHCAALASLGSGAVDQIPLVRHPDVSVACPREWAEQYEHVVWLADLKSEERERMLAHYRLAVDADPGHVDAAVRLLGHMVDDGDWAGYDTVSARLVTVAPDDPRAHLFRGLGLHARGRLADAAQAFAEALARMEPAERQAFGDVELLLRRRVRERYAELDSDGREDAARIFFAGTDPLYLSGVNERRLEHYARLARAELKYGEPASGFRGWESERGRVFVRYGAPWRWYQCCYGVSDASQFVQKRLVYWSYGAEGPLFVFERPLTYRRARMTEPTKALADDLAGHAPELYRPRTITAVHELPHQVVRFRGSGPGLTRVEIFAAPPVDSLGAAPGADVEAGIFLFDDAYRPLWDRRHQAPVTEHGLPLLYRVELPPGEYRYGIEARAAGPDTLARPAARSRSPLEVAGFPDDRVAISDLLLASDVRPRAGAPASRREELLISANRGTAFRPGAPIHLYFETYGLVADEDGLARFRAELAVEDSTRRNRVERLARGAQELFRGRAPETRVGWERVVEMVDGAAIDYLAVEVPALEPGEYMIRLRVTDLATGRSAETARPVRIAEPPRPEPR